MMKGRATEKNDIKVRVIKHQHDMLFMVFVCWYFIAKLCKKMTENDYDDCECRKRVTEKKQELI